MQHVNSFLDLISYWDISSYCISKEFESAEIKCRDAMRRGLAYLYRREEKSKKETKLFCRACAAGFHQITKPLFLVRARASVRATTEKVRDKKVRWKEGRKKFGSLSNSPIFHIHRCHSSHFITPFLTSRSFITYITADPHPYCISYSHPNSHSHPIPIPSHGDIYHATKNSSEVPTTLPSAKFIFRAHLHSCFSPSATCPFLLLYWPDSYQTYGHV